MMLRRKSTDKERIVRCQGVVYRDNCILIIQHKNLERGNVYWWLPGGGQKPGETQEECVVREVREETCLNVKIERLLFEGDDPYNRYIYQRYATYLCSPISGEVAIGSEDEPSSGHPIVGIGWYPLWDETRWEPGFFEEHLHPLLKSLQLAMGEERT